MPAFLLNLLQALSPGFTDFQMLLNSLLSALPLFALCTKNSSLMMIFALLLAFALLFAVDPPCSTTDDA